ncbi:hypothetical protein [Pseudomonas sp. H3(2019)]|uniref:hypothetical protein n=1 Tax=Pseudomonas sp. H3(2019) TaxID=2598724 RepID=UPI0011968CDC|nr:hypothetical protein [Pseudomonas sp. H3(2019)]TVT79839.1 hypothetical protein FPT12_24965 [Pseudomonas sp. H3(2019)]
MTHEKFSADNAALLLIDHQVGTMSWVKSIPFEELKRNALRRMDKGGVTLTTTNQLIAELAGSWATPQGGQLVQVLMTAL